MIGFMTASPDTSRQALLEAALKLAPFEGWNASMLSKAEDDAGLGGGMMALYFPDGVMGVLDYWAGQMDEAVETHLARLDLSAMKIRDKVTAGVLARLEAIGEYEEAARRASARLALPDGIGHCTGQIWAAADTIWRAIGDRSTDVNFYSKRAILSGVIGSSMAAWLSDESADKSQARQFLDDRIANVMQFEKFKWQVKSKTKDWPSPAALLGGLRYGDGFKRRRRRRSRTL